MKALMETALAALCRWYRGGVKESGVPTFGGVKTYTTDRHWTAKVAAKWVAFYLRNWRTLWTLLLAAVAAYAAFL